jgi:cysteine-rich repeat protein
MTEQPAAQCGDGTVDQGEQCDDGNTQSGDGCSASCMNEEPAAQCGDGTVDQGEQCDDGNTQSGDGCSASCMNEAEVVQLPGTWITPATTFASTIEAPVVGTADIQVAIALAIRVTPEGSISAQVCSLNLNETALGLQFVDSPQEIQSAPAQLDVLTYDVGAAFPIQNVTLSGDSLVVNATALGLNGLSVDLDVAVSLNATFNAADELSGTSSVTTTGNVSLNGLPLGPMSIPATGDPTPSLGFNAVRVSSDPALSCEAAAALL